MEEKKIAILFPGIGYHVDKPLLYYAGKLARNYNYEVVPVPYTGFEAGIKGNARKMEQAFLSAMEQAEKILLETDFSQYNRILFISKSVGTVVASAYAKEHEIDARHILYTPVEATFGFLEQEGIIFHGTADPWVETDIVEKACEQKKLPLYIFEDANHSMETGNVSTDLENMRKIMKITEKYMKEV